MNLDNLKTLIDAGDHDGVVTFFANASEAERTGVAGYVLERLKEQQSNNRIIEIKPGTFAYNSKLRAAELAAIAACSLSQLKHLGNGVVVAGPEVCAIFVAHRPKWLGDWAESAIENNPYNWPMIRYFMQLGLCRKPKSDNYVLGVLHGILDRNPWRNYGRDETTLVAALLDDDEFLKRDIWRLFEIEGNGEHSLSAHDKYFRRPGRAWNHALVELSRLGELSRERLLDASLDSLSRDFAQFRAGWFSRFHDLMEPTSEEQRARTERYLGLLASSIPTTISWA